MNFQWEDGSVVFGELDEFWTELLRRLPESAAVHDEPAQRRLFGAPTAGTEPTNAWPVRQTTRPRPQRAAVCLGRLIAVPLIRPRRSC